MCQGCQKFAYVDPPLQKLGRPNSWIRHWCVIISSHEVTSFLRNMQRMRSAIPLPRSRSHSAQSVLSASGYSAGFRGPAGTDDIQDGRQIRKVTAYNERRFERNHILKGCSHGAIATTIYFSQLRGCMGPSVIVAIAICEHLH